MSRLTTTSCLALALSAVAGALPAQEETGGFGVAKNTDLGSIRATPHAYKNVWVTFQGHFFGIGAIHNPFFTRFTRADYVNFGIWADDQKIWERPEYDDPCASLFCPKSNSKLLTRIYKLQRYQRVRITGVVRNAFQGEPWIEVTELKPISGRVTTATLTHMSRAHSLIQGHKWQQAAIELNLAASQELTSHARGWVHGYLGLCLMRLGRPKEAGLQFSAAKKLLPAETIVDEWLDALANDPRAAVDTQVLSSVRRGDRPMWEAVEEQEARDKKKATPRGVRKRPITRKKPRIERKVPSGNTQKKAPARPANTGPGPIEPPAQPGGTKPKAGGPAKDPATQPAKPGK